MKRFRASMKESVLAGVIELPEQLGLTRPTLDALRFSTPELGKFKELVGFFAKLESLSEALSKI